MILSFSNNYIHHVPLNPSLLSIVIDTWQMSFSPCQVSPPNILKSCNASSQPVLIQGTEQGKQICLVPALSSPCLGSLFLWLCWNGIKEEKWEISDITHWHERIWKACYFQCSTWIPPEEQGFSLDHTCVYLSPLNREASRGCVLIRRHAMAWCAYCGALSECPLYTGIFEHLSQLVAFFQEVV